MSTDDTTKKVSMYPKCRNCKYLTNFQDDSGGFWCRNPNKVWKSEKAPYRKYSAKGCVQYIGKDENS